MGFDQSSPVQPVSDFRGGSPEPDKQSPNERTEILVSNIGFLSFCLHLGQICKSDTDLQSLGIPLQPQGHKIVQLMIFYSALECCFFLNFYFPSAYLFFKVPELHTA